MLCVLNEDKFASLGRLGYRFLKFDLALTSVLEICAWASEKFGCYWFNGLCVLNKDNFGVPVSKGRLNIDLCS
jgi:hypothetical protein